MPQTDNYDTIPLTQLNDEADNGSSERQHEHGFLPLRSRSPNEIASSPHPPPPYSSKNESNGDNEAPRTTKQSGVIRTWYLEAISLITSAAALTGLLIILARQDGKPLSTWTMPLSLNTIVSLLSVTVKTPLAFVVGNCIAQGKWAWFSKRQGPLAAFVAIEEAGRGPLGSLQLMWKLKLRHWVSFGAVITLGLLAIDPLLQSVILYQGKMSPAAASGAVIARSSRLDIGQWFFDAVFEAGQKFGGREALVNCYDLYPDIGVSAATQMGFVNTPLLSLIEPPDVSSRMKRQTGLGMDERCTNSFTYQEPFVEYRLPYGQKRDPLIMWGMRDKYENETVSCNKRQGTRTELAVSFRPNETISFQDWDTLLASFATIHVEDDYWSGRIPWKEATVQATECALQYCIQVYKPTMESGKVVEGEIPVSFQRVPGSWGMDFETSRNPINDPRLLKDVQDAFGSSLARLNESSCWLFPRYDLQLEILEEDTTLPRDVQRVFNITHKSVATMMESFGPETVRSINRALSNSTNITASFDSAARLTSFRMREIDNIPAEGSAEHWVIYIRVRWPPIAAPVAICIAVIVFSGRVIIESRRIHLEALKSDPMELLLHGFDSASRDYLRENRYKGLKVDEVNVKLQGEAEGPELRANTPR
ncbi:hypothetical protein NM208_g14184 [Fusarium decemcellulare]|uniref:Uncharacterized protein n=1 Tax=Fusarium decemcellulare TaxID=57161 RepID=A0ACC1RI83_9HYPO|nr:hypothetical protein NM208_g14184 [Fusarium decemcellulare]